LSAQEAVLRGALCLLGAAVFVAGVIGTVKQGWWKQ